MAQTELQDILRQLVAEIQHLRVEQAVSSARQRSGANIGSVKDAEKAAKKKAIEETASLLEKIDALK